jgi:D-galactose 1-dehydrogenase
MIRIGVIGLGKIATGRHLPAIGENAGFVLAGVADLAAAAPEGVRLFRSHMAMLEALTELDAVTVCTPPIVRGPIALDALAAGLHVMVEKPPTASLGALLGLQQAAAQAGKVLFTAWHSQHNAAVDAARARLAGETVVRVEVTWTEDVHKWHPGQDWIWRAGGFGVFDPGINAMSIPTRILPLPVAVKRAALSIPRDADTPIAAEVTLDLGSGEGRMVLDWRKESGEIREMTITTASGAVLELVNNGKRLLVDGVAVAENPVVEYPLTT